MDKITDWFDILTYQNLPEQFLRKYFDKFEIRKLMMYQDLSEHFMEDYAKYFDWNDLFWYQYLTPEFIEKHKDKFFNFRFMKIATREKDDTYKMDHGFHQYE